MYGKIFDIQRFSIHDGPGIRTSIFFKGCNLRCLWCHNPESQYLYNELMFFENKCTDCGKCRQICNKAFTDNCTACGKCVSICDNGARKIDGKNVSSDFVIEEVIKDKCFYEASGGGVTLTGGEPLLQSDFALEILKKCKINGINTNIETAGNVQWKVFEKVLPYLDSIYFDIKCIDADKHVQLTGFDNDLILENAEKLKSVAKGLRFRMPVIPTLNEDEIHNVVQFAGNFPIELLGYHTSGIGKYRALGREYPLQNINPVTREYMIKLAREYGAIYE